MEDNMPTLDRAIKIAAAAHIGQKDKSGQPYILHPLRVMFTVQTEEEKIVAVLHDTVEDTEVTFEELKTNGFSDVIIEALRSVTKNPGETRMDAARRAKANPIGRQVKLADLKDNMNIDRIAEPTQKDWDRLKEYHQVKTFLLSD